MISRLLVIKLHFFQTNSSGKESAMNNKVQTNKTTLHFVTRRVQILGFTFLVAFFIGVRLSSCRLDTGNKEIPVI